MFPGRVEEVAELLGGHGELRVDHALDGSRQSRWCRSPRSRGSCGGVHRGAADGRRCRGGRGMAGRSGAAAALHPILQSVLVARHWLLRNDPDSTGHVFATDHA
eukprot:9224101-Pyramimonas_sp.AAC.1